MARCGHRPPVVDPNMVPGPPGIVRRMTAHPGPLAGIRVLDFSRVLSGPHCARNLADLGADVIKVEPPEGDMTRSSFPRRNSIATYFTQQNVGKQNISLDLKKPEAVELLLRLTEHADVIVENFRPDVMGRMGLGYDVVAARNPRIVYASISGYGATGPWVNRRAYASVIEAEAGMLTMQAEAHGGNLANDPLSHADVYTGLECALAIAAALFQRERSGRGQHIDVSMAETMLYVNEHVHWELLRDLEGVDGDDDVPSFLPGEYPVFPTAEGHHVIVAGHPASGTNFTAFCRAIGKPDMIDDARFATTASRRVHLDNIVDAVKAWTATFTDLDALEAALYREGLVMGVLRSVSELATSEWAVDRGAIVEVDDRRGGTVRVPNSPWRFSGATTGVTGVPAYRGEHNHSVFASLCGLGDDELAALDAAGVFSSRLPK
jgi:CoA:oxalate CoA-transferase